MKKSAFFAALVFILFMGNYRANGQSLGFSDVILLIRGTTDTVPAGKVWKVEAFSGKQESCGSWYSAQPVISINAVNNFLGFVTRDGNGTSYDSYPGMPFWLPAGTIVNLPTSGCLQTLSIIEFNVTP